MKGACSSSKGSDHQPLSSGYIKSPLIDPDDPQGYIKHTYGNSELPQELCKPTYISSRQITNQERKERGDSAKAMCDHYSPGISKLQYF